MGYFGFATLCFKRLFFIFNFFYNLSLYRCIFSY